MSKSLGFSGAVETRVHFEGDEMITEDIMHGRQVQDILDHNARMRSQGHNPHARGRHAASIPLPLYFSWQEDWKRNHADKWEWQTYLAMKLNDRDYAYLRTGVNKL